VAGFLIAEHQCTMMRWQRSIWRENWSFALISQFIFFVREFFDIWCMLIVNDVEGALFFFLVV